MRWIAESIHPVIQLAVAGRKGRLIVMAVFRADDGREIDELDVLKALKYYEFLFHAKHSTSRANKASNGGSSPKPSAKLRKALVNTPETRANAAHVEVKAGHKIVTRIVKA